MTKFIKDLFYDKDIVGRIETTNMSKEMLYNHLFIGRITLQEYLAAEKKIK